MKKNSYNNEEHLWAIVKERGFDENFFYAVKTTGVYCKPGCSSRLPNRDNVEFFKSAEEARKKGYRPCKRCKPEQPAGEDKNLQMIVSACRRIMEADTPPRLEKLAKEAGLSPYYFHRKFKEIVGVTPKQFGAMHQTQRFQNSLQINATVTEAIYDAGFSSSSRVYEKTRRTMAMQPLQFKNGAPGQSIEYGMTKCYLGWVLVAATQLGICLIEFADSQKQLEDQLHQRFPKAQIIEAGAEFSVMLNQVVSHIEKPATTLELPLDIQGTAFQQRVWKALLDIPVGTTKTYSEVADMIGQPQAARAVASAVAANTIAVAIPCHRVVRKDGGVGGYRWGEGRKRNILECEKHS